MKVLHCRDAGFDCDAVVQGDSEAEILDKVRTHALSDHGVEVTADVEVALRPLIHAQE